MRFKERSPHAIHVQDCKLAQHDASLVRISAFSPQNCRSKANPSVWVCSSRVSSVELFSGLFSSLLHTYIHPCGAFIFSSTATAAPTSLRVFRKYHFNISMPFTLPHLPLISSHSVTLSYISPDGTVHVCERNRRAGRSRGG